MDDQVAPPPSPAPAPLPAEDQPPPPPRRRIGPGLLWALALAVVVLTIASWVALSSEVTSTGSAGDDVVHLGGGGNTVVVPDSAAGTGLVGRPAPETAFTTLEGAPASLAELRGSPVVLNFWQSSCAPCLTEMPDLEKVHQHYGERVRFLGVATADTPDAARRMATRTGVTYPLGLDADGELATAFDLLGIPTTVLIDARGTVVHQAPPRALTADELTRLVDEKLHP